MGKRSKLRAWINRDDGRLYQVGNTTVGSLTIIGGLTMVAALVLSQLHRHVGIHLAWPIAVGVVGTAVFLAGLYADDRRNDV